MKFDCILEGHNVNLYGFKNNYLFELHLQDITNIRVNVQFFWSILKPVKNLDYALKF